MCLWEQLFQVSFWTTSSMVYYFVPWPPPKSLWSSLHHTVSEVSKAQFISCHWAPTFMRSITPTCLCSTPSCAFTLYLNKIKTLLWPVGLYKIYMIWSLPVSHFLLVFPLVTHCMPHWYSLNTPYQALAYLSVLTVHFLSAWNIFH